MADESDTVQQEPQEKVTFSQEQQKFIDEIFSKRFGEVSAKHETELKQMEERYKNELEKSRMDDEERIKAEEAERIQDLTKRAEDAERRLRVAFAEKELAKAGLPTELAETIMGADDAQMMKNVAALSKVATERANALYAERVSSGAPDAPRNQVEPKAELYQKVRAAAGLNPS